MTTIHRTESITENEFGHRTRVVIETGINGENHRPWSIAVRAEIVEDFGDAVQLVRRTVICDNAAGGGANPSSDVRLQIDLDRPEAPSPIEHAETEALLMRHIDELLAAADLFGSLAKPDARAFLVQTKGRGCLPVQA